MSDKINMSEAASTSPVVTDHPGQTDFFEAGLISGFTTDCPRLVEEDRRGVMRLDGLLTEGAGQQEFALEVMATLLLPSVAYCYRHGFDPVDSGNMLEGALCHIWDNVELWGSIPALVEELKHHFKHEWQWTEVRGSVEQIMNLSAKGLEVADEIVFFYEEPLSQALALMVLEDECTDPAALCLADIIEGEFWDDAVELAEERFAEMFPVDEEIA